MEFLKKGFDVFLLPSFEDKSCYRILDLLEFVKKLKVPLSVYANLLVLGLVFINSKSAHLVWLPRDQW